MALLFMLGVIEMMIVTVWTKVVVETRILASGAVTMVNIFIWYYVVSRIVGDISNLALVFAYAFGCAIGTMCATALSVPRYQQWLHKQFEPAITALSAIVTYDIT